MIQRIANTKECKRKVYQLPKGHWISKEEYDLMKEFEKKGGFSTVRKFMYASQCNKKS